VSAAVGVGTRIDGPTATHPGKTFVGRGGASAGRPRFRPSVPRPEQTGHGIVVVAGVDEDEAEAEEEEDDVSEFVDVVGRTVTVFVPAPRHFQHAAAGAAGTSV
jgi:hypothetical protein